MTPHRDEKYKEWVRSQSCCLRGWGLCEGDVVPHHHLGQYLGGGKGLKGSDYGAVPLCCGHHRDVHDGRTELAQDLRLVAWIVEHLPRWPGRRVDAKALRITLGSAVRDLVELVAL